MIRNKITQKILFIFLFTVSFAVMAQEGNLDISNMSKEDVMELSYDQMLELPLADLMALADIVGVSLDELYDMILNKDVVSASKSEESIFDSPLSTTVISYEEIVSSGATSIEEALRMSPGIIVREKSNGVYDVQIRGGQNMPMNNMLIYAENTTTLVMVDGRPVFNYGMGGILWETIPISIGELDRIEIVRGPSSALYGPNAVNGVINLISKDIDDDSPIVAANVQGGTLSTVVGDVHVAKKINEKISLGVSGTFETRDRANEGIYAIYADEFLTIEEFAVQNKEQLWSNNDYTTALSDRKSAKEKMGANVYFDYNVNPDISFNVSSGYLETEAMTSTLGDNPSAHTNRNSEGYFANITGSIYKFNLQASANNVYQDFARGRSGWQQSTEQYNVNLDYLLEMGKLSFRPGVSYQSVYYDDRDHIDSLGLGFFNDRVVLRNYAVSGRFDYTPTEKLRFVAALRAEKYNVPDKWMPSYQFVGSYKLTENNLVRAVYSRANQSTFLINAYSNYTWDRQGLPGPSYVAFGSNNDPNMMIMDMVELGYRTRPKKWLLIDVEAFYNKAKDYSALMPDSLSYTVTGLDMSDPGNPAPIGEQTLYVSHRSLSIESEQYGVSLSVNMVISEKLQLKTHVNWQQTKVNKFTDASRDQIATLQGAELTTTVEANLAGDAMTILSGTPVTYTSDLQPGENTTLEQQLDAGGVLNQIEVLNNMDNEAIPAFYGSLSLTYKPIEKLSITAQGYYYDKSYIYSQYENDPRRAALLSMGVKNELDYTGKLDAKFLLNAKISYQVSKNLDVFVNGRNILNNEQQEYVFMDKSSAVYLAGLNFRLYK